MPRVRKVKALGLAYQFLEGLKPKFLKRKVEHNIFSTLGRLIRMIFALRKSTSRDAPPPFIGMHRIAFLPAIPHHSLLAICVTYPRSSLHLQHSFSMLRD